MQNGYEARFVAPEWQGRNRLDDRLQGADGLAAEVASAADQGDVVVVAHSHGGSACAHYLSAATSLPRQLLGCAFLATPFIIARPRDLVPIYKLCIFLVRGFLLSLMVGELVSVGTTAALGRPIPTGPAWAILLGALATSVTAELVYRRAIHPTPVLSSPPAAVSVLPGLPYLFVRLSGDEAALAISFAQTISLVIAAMQRWLHGAFDAMGRDMGTRGVAALGLLAALLHPISFFLVDQLSSHQIIHPQKLTIAMLANMSAPLAFLSTNAFYVLAFIGLVIGLSLPVGLALASLCQGLLARAFGWTTFRQALSAELAIEPLPVGQHKLHHVDWSTADAGCLSHSAVYAHPEALKALGEWTTGILSRAAAQPQGTHHAGTADRDAMKLPQRGDQNWPAA